ncbi:MAG: aminoglycoside phosphotransferase family protein [Ruminococcaceae bacterium]|nr:aminoglycoside phosphotransferase family protein [Oscillospiraceae bacterium]
MASNNQYELKEILSRFNINTDIEVYGNGHINDTYLCETAPRFILQKINTNVFNNPTDVMENIYNVTKHLSEKIKKAGGDADRETLTVIPTKNNEIYYKNSDGACFRMYKYIENSVSYDVAEDPKILCSAGRAFGKFQKMLSDFPAEKLHETIIDFHNTPIRVKQLETAIENNSANRLDNVKEEIEFAKRYAKYADKIVSEMALGTVPLRVTHNDTKLNNVLFDEKTNDGVCVIDLDTVMSGSLLYDFGDALRFGASSCVEDETDENKIWFDLEKFEQFAKGFLSEVKDCLTQKEIELLPVSALIMTYECGIRFLADYLNGDTYFKIHKENHNLDRARNQFKLVEDIESKFNDMAKIVAKYVNN